MTHLRTRSLRLLLAGALALGVAGTTTTAYALSPQPAEVTVQLDPIDPIPPIPPVGDDECDPDTELCAVPVDPVDAEDCPVIEVGDGEVVPDGGCRPPEDDCLRIDETEAGTIIEIDPDCLPCPTDEGPQPVGIASHDPAETRPNDPCEPPVDECDETTDERRPQVRSGDDDVVELQRGPRQVRDDCEPDRPNFTG